MADTPLGPMERDKWDLWRLSPLVEDELGRPAGGLLAVPLFDGERLEMEVDDLEIENGEAPDPQLVSALERLLALPRERAKEIEPHLWLLYSHMRDLYVEHDLFSDDYYPTLPEIAGPADVWQHVQLTGATATRRDGRTFVVVGGNCDWDVEHGLQIVFLDGTRLVRVSEFDDHMTDGRASGGPASDAWMADPDAPLPLRRRS